MCGTAVIRIKCSITNNVWIRSHDIKDAAMQLILGVPCLDETIAGFKLQLPPVKNLWNTTHGAEMLCQALEELLVPSKKMTVLEIGCGIGLLGLYLSKVCIACSICLFLCFKVLQRRSKGGVSLQVCSPPSTSFTETTTITTTAAAAAAAAAAISCHEPCLLLPLPSTGPHCVTAASTF
jgi:hypothetical protein